MSQVVRYLFKPTEILSRFILRRLITDPYISIISDDCWGAEYYRELNLPYLTPTVGLWIQAPDYMRFISELEKNLQSELVFIGSDHGYPVATVNGCEIGFMHYKSEDEARQKWEHRCRRVNFRRLFFKVDFGRPRFTQQDIVWWNQLALPNAIALLNDSCAGMHPSVHQGVYVPDWELNGAALYNVSKQYFSLSRWVNAGTLRKPRRDLLLDLLLFNRRFHH